MSSDADHNLLVELNAQFKAFYEEFRRVSNGIGFPRCAERLGKIEALESSLETAHKRIDMLNNRLWWAVTLALGSFATLIMTALKGVLKL